MVSASSIVKWNYEDMFQKKKKEEEHMCKKEKEFIYLFNTYLLSTSHMSGSGIQWWTEEAQISALAGFTVLKGSHPKDRWGWLYKMQVLGTHLYPEIWILQMCGHAQESDFVYARGDSAAGFGRLCWWRYHRAMVGEGWGVTDFFPCIL